MFDFYLSTGQLLSFTEFNNKTELSAEFFATAHAYFLFLIAYFMERICQHPPFCAPGSSSRVSAAFQGFREGPM